MISTLQVKKKSTETKRQQRTRTWWRKWENCVSHGKNKKKNEKEKKSKEAVGRLRQDFETDRRKSNSNGDWTREKESETADGQRCPSKQRPQRPRYQVEADWWIRFHSSTPLGANGVHGREPTKRTFDSFAFTSSWILLEYLFDYFEYIFE